MMRILKILNCRIACSMRNLSYICIRNTMPHSSPKLKT